MRNTTAALLLCALLALPTLAAVQNPDSPFGVICSWAGIKDSGVKWVRCGAGCTALDWGAVEKERGVYDWKNADAEVNGWTKDEGVDLLVILGYTPKWASSDPNGDNSAPPRDLKDWTDFVFKVVSRYKGKVKYWEVWNEPDIGFWTGTIEQYSDLIKSAYVAAKKADPDCRIVFGGLAGVNLPFLERVYQNGGKYFFDVMAVHPYQWGDTFNDEWFSLQLRNLHNLMSKYRDGHKEVWLTELGWSTGDPGITEKVQARLLQQAMITSFTLGDANVTKTFWFSVKDWGGPGYGLIRPDGTRKPAFDAYRFVTDKMEGAAYCGPLKHDTLRCHFFRGRNGELFLVVWHPGKGTATLQLPAEHTWIRAHVFGYDPSVRKLYTHIEVGPNPVFVFSDSGIPHPFSPVPKMPRDPYLRNVWMGIHSGEGTSGFYIVRGQPHQVAVRVHNDSDKPSTVLLQGKIGLFGAKQSVAVGARETADAVLAFALPARFKLGMEDMRITGSAYGKPLAPIETPVRVSDGPVIEFLANSTVESRYIVENENSGGAPSVRFGGTWTYKFDLSKARRASIELNVGAHQANEWQVLVSSDRLTWNTVLSGRSNRSWHKADLSRYVGGPVYVKFTGNDQQLSELLLMTSESP